MDIHLIRNGKEYDKVMKEIVELAESCSSNDPAKMEKLEILTMLVKHFDEKNYK